MVVKNNFIRSLLFYRIPQLLLIAIVFYLSREYLFNLMCNLTGITERDRLFYGLTSLIVYGGLLFAWVMIAFTTLRSQRYLKLTGRNFGYDSGQYKRGYFSLVDYFKDANPYKMDEESLPLENWRQTEGVILGHLGPRLVKRKSSGEGNFLTIGRPGSHKTTSQIVPTALRFKGG